MPALTPLGQQRADTVCVHQAARALRAGCRPEQVVAGLATYVGLALPEPWPAGLDDWSDGYDVGHRTALDEARREIDYLEAEITRLATRRRWWSR